MGQVVVGTFDKWKFNALVDALNDCRDVQGTDGNWNKDKYNLGLYNGLELGSSIMEDREPEYRELIHEST